METQEKEKTLKEQFDDISYTMFKLDNAGITTLSELDAVVVLCNEIENNFKHCKSNSGFTTDEIIQKEMENFDTQYDDIEVTVTGYCTLNITVKLTCVNDKYIKVTRHVNYNYHDHIAELNDDLDIETDTGISSYLSVNNVYTIDGFMAELNGVA